MKKWFLKTCNHLCFMYGNAEGEYKGIVFPSPQLLGELCPRVL